jgi:REP-associated tyrosine transposase
MPRQRRWFVPDLSVHVIHRGNNRTEVFKADADYVAFLTFLQRACERHRVSLHGYVLMTTHYHMIVTPPDATALPRTMQALGANYVRYHNARYDRIGTLWNGRYRALLIDSDKYWLTCLRYVEQNPVRAGMVETPAAYSWSSYSAHASGRWPAWLTPHPVYAALGSTAEQRQVAYRNLCNVALPEDQLILLRSSLGAPVLVP